MEGLGLEIPPEYQEYVRTIEGGGDKMVSLYQEIIRSLSLTVQKAAARRRENNGNSNSSRRGKKGGSSRRRKKEDGTREPMFDMETAAKLMRIITGRHGTYYDICNAFGLDVEASEVQEEPCKTWIARVWKDERGRLINFSETLEWPDQTYPHINSATAARSKAIKARVSAAAAREAAAEAFKSFWPPVERVLAIVFDAIKDGKESVEISSGDCAVMRKMCPPRDMFVVDNDDAVKQKVLPPRFGKVGMKNDEETGDDDDDDSWGKFSSDVDEDDVLIEKKKKKKVIFPRYPAVFRVPQSRREAYLKGEEEKEKGKGAWSWEYLPDVVAPSLMFSTVRAYENNRNAQQDHALNKISLEEVIGEGVSWVRKKKKDDKEKKLESAAAAADDDFFRGFETFVAGSYKCYMPDAEALWGVTNTTALASRIIRNEGDCTSFEFSKGWIQMGDGFWVPTTAAKRYFNAIRAEEDEVRAKEDAMAAEFEDGAVGVFERWGSLISILSIVFGRRGTGDDEDDREDVKVIDRDTMLEILAGWVPLQEIQIPFFSSTQLSDKAKDLDYIDHQGSHGSTSLIGRTIVPRQVYDAMVARITALHARADELEALEELMKCSNPCIVDVPPVCDDGFEYARCY